MQLTRGVRGLTVFLLLCLILKCYSAPVLQEEESSLEDGGTILNSAERNTQTEPVQQGRQGRFLNGLFYPAPASRYDPYYRNPHYYGYGVPSAPNTYYQPVFQYRQARRKRKRLFVPNVWG